MHKQGPSVSRPKSETKIFHDLLVPFCYSRRKKKRGEVCAPRPQLVCSFFVTSSLWRLSDILLDVGWRPPATSSASRDPPFSSVMPRVIIHSSETLGKKTLSFTRTILSRQNLIWYPAWHESSSFLTSCSGEKSKIFFIVHIYTGYFAFFQPFYFYTFW